MDKDKYASHMVLGSEPPRLNCIKPTTGEERKRVQSTQDTVDDARELKPSGGSLADEVTGGNGHLRCTKPYTLGTWNVRGMSLGKLDVIKREMHRTRTDMIGISEMHWKQGSGEKRCSLRGEQENLKMR